VQDVNKVLKEFYRDEEKMNRKKLNKKVEMKSMTRAISPLNKLTDVLEGYIELKFYYQEVITPANGS